MNTITLASVFELQGHKEEALEIYKNILKKNPNSQEAKVGIRRLSGARKKFVGVDEKMKQFFIQMDSEDEFRDFERWLIQKWR